MYGCLAKMSLAKCLGVWPNVSGQMSGCLAKCLLAKCLGVWPNVSGQMSGQMVLVRFKSTAYGRATLGAKPFRRAPFTATRCGMNLVKPMNGNDRLLFRTRTQATKNQDGLCNSSNSCTTHLGPNGAFTYVIAPALRGKPNPRPTGVVD